MSDKRKSTPKAKLLTAVLLVLFLGSCAVLVFAICTDILGINNSNPTEPATTASTGAATESTPADNTLPSTAEASTATDTNKADLYFASKYEIIAVCDENGDEMDLRVAFGNSFREGFVEFDSDRFFIGLTVQGPPENYGGTYSFISDSEIELRYDNSNIKSAFIKDVDDTGIVTEVDVTMSSDFVITCVVS